LLSFVVLQYNHRSLRRLQQTIDIYSNQYTPRIIPWTPYSLLSNNNDHALCPSSIRSQTWSLQERRPWQRWHNVLGRAAQWCRSSCQTQRRWRRAAGHLSCEATSAPRIQLWKDYQSTLTENPRRKQTIYVRKRVPSTASDTGRLP